MISNPAQASLALFASLIIRTFQLVFSAGTVFRLVFSVKRMGPLSLMLFLSSPVKPSSALTNRINPNPLPAGAHARGSMGRKGRRGRGQHRAQVSLPSHGRELLAHVSGAPGALDE